MNLSSPSPAGYGETQRAENHGDVVPEGTGSAMLIMDLINNFDYPGSDALLAQTREILPSVLTLRERYDAAQRPVIYANDNFGRWRSEFAETVEYCARPGAPGRDIVRQVAPRSTHYSILKPRHTAFFMTPLKLLLDELHIEALTIVGIAGDQCVLFTAMDAHLRDYGLWVPIDTMASITPERNQRATDYMREVLGARVDEVKAAGA